MDYSKKTKQQLIDLLEKGKEASSALKAEVFNPQEEMKQVKEKENVEECKTISSASIIYLAEQIAKEIDYGKKSLLNITNAVSTKERELKEVYDIETSLIELTTVIEAGKIAVSEKEDKLNEISGKICEKTVELIDVEKTLKEKFIYSETALKKDFARMTEELQYQHKIAARDLQDKLKQERETFNQEVAKKQAYLDEFKQKLEERSDEVIDMQNKIDDFPNVLRDGISNEVSIMRQKINTELEHKLAMSESEYKNKLLELQGTNKSMGFRINEQEKTIADLNAKLSDAYQKVTDMATKVAEASSKVIIKDSQSK